MTAESREHTTTGNVRRHLGHVAALALTVLVAAGLTYTVVARGTAERWNATDAEVASVLPGDDLIADPSIPMTRAVTIDAPPERVWPWIVQFGQGRGGLYSYDWLENLAGCDIHTLDHIDPALQHLAVGDRVYVTPDGYPADLGMVVDQIDPERALVLRLSTTKQPFARTESPWTWSFVLEPTGDGRTRLIARERYRSGGAVADTLSRQTIGPIDFVMSRRMLTGIAERAEQAAGRGTGPSSGETVWFAGVLVAFGGLLATLASKRALRSRLAIAAGGGAVLALVVFCSWSPWIAWLAAAASIAVAYASWRPRRVPSDPEKPGPVEANHPTDAVLRS